jgi:glycosyltransferase involved in cell wall biosynthesis
MARIGVDARPLTVSLSGIGRYTFEILQRLADSGHQFYLYSDRAIPDAHLPAGDFICRHGDIKRGLLASLYAQWQYPRWAGQDNLDLFWSPRHHLPLLLRNTPEVVTVHDLVWRQAGQTMRRGGRILEALLMPPSLRKAERVIAVSAATAEDLCDLENIAQDKLRVIHEASRLQGAHQGEAQPPYILFVGTLEPRKNLPRLLQAYARLVQETSIPHQLVLAGQPGWMREDLLQLLGELGISERVSITGFINDEALAGWYSQASLLAMPSLYEGFGLPLVEAMAFGVPLLTSTVSAMPEIAGDAAVLVEPLDENSIYGGLCEVLLDQERWQQLADNAKDRGSKFSWDKAGKETLQVFQELLGEGEYA